MAKQKLNTQISHLPSHALNGIFSRFDFIFAAYIDIFSTDCRACFCNLVIKSSVSPKMFECRNGRSQWDLVNEFKRFMRKVCCWFCQPCVNLSANNWIEVFIIIPDCPKVYWS